MLGLLIITRAQLVIIRVVVGIKCGYHCCRERGAEYKVGGV